MLGCSALGADDGVLTVVLDPHEGDLADRAALTSTGGEDDDGQTGVHEGVALSTTGALVQIDLVAHPLGGARPVLALADLRGHVDRKSTRLNSSHVASA